MKSFIQRLLGPVWPRAESRARSTNTPRTRAHRGFWLGPGPIGLTVTIAASLLLGWRVVADPDAPSTYWKFDPAVERNVDFPWSKSVMSIYGNADADSVLVVGDSRTSSAVSLRVLHREGIADVGVLWGALAQVRHLLRAARELPPRRLVVCLSPASLNSPQLPRLVHMLELERRLSPMQRIDRRLDDELDVLRQRLLRPVEINSWLRGRTAEDVQPRRQEGLYDGLLRPENRPALDERLAELQVELAAMRKEGWTIACVRLPAEIGVEVVENKAFARAKFARMCADLDVPFLDLFGGGYATTDGSHLLGADADRASTHIARWLRGLPGFESR